MFVERTLIVLKPDSVKRGVVGEILHRFERAGLKIVGAKFVLPDRELAHKHYKPSKEYFLAIGNRTLEDCERWGINPVDSMGTSDPEKIGEIVQVYLVDFLSSGPVLAVVLEGLHAVQNARSLVGHTVPLLAQPGSIRGDFGLHSAVSANFQKKAIVNLIHASGTLEEAKYEIDLWFKKSEVLDYKMLHED